MGIKSNTGIVLDASAPKYARGARFTSRNKQKIVDGIRVGLHPEVAAARAGWLPHEFEELLGRSVAFQRMIMKEYAQYEYKRADQIDQAADPKTAMAYLERCRKRWSHKVDVSLAPLAKMALDRIETELKSHKTLTGEQALDIVLDAFASEGARSVFD